jgi:hypothetical protein
MLNLQMRDLDAELRLLDLVPADLTTQFVCLSAQCVAFLPPFAALMLQQLAPLRGFGVKQLADRLAISPILLRQSPEHRLAPTMYAEHMSAFGSAMP